MSDVGQLLHNKGCDIFTIGPDETVYQAIKRMDEKGIGALVVIDGQSVAGIISERDYARKIILKNRSSKDTAVKDIMTRDVYFATPEQDIEQCMLIMSKHHIRHLPVVADGTLLGMITLGDVVKEIIKAQKIQIEHLEQTISWGESY